MTIETADQLPKRGRRSGSAADRWAMLHDVTGLTRLLRVLDIGANPLDVPIYRPLFDAGLCEVFGFEPQQAAYERLQDTKTARETYVQAAVGDGTPVHFKSYASSGLSSILPIDMRTVDLFGRSKRAASLLNETEILTTRLDDLDTLPEPDLLKIDVQGAESIILAHGSVKLSRLVGVVTELRFFELYEAEDTLDAQVRILRDRGFRMHKILHTKSAAMHSSRRDRLNGRRVRNQLIDGDAAFLRDLRDPTELTNEEIGFTALVADAIYRSYDVSLHCLDLLAARGRLSDDIIEKYFRALPPEVRRE